MTADATLHHDADPSRAYALYVPLFAPAQERADEIDILVHPESVVHSMIEMIDGSVIAQMGVTDMRHAIQYALTYPERHDCQLPPLDLTVVGGAPDPGASPLARGVATGPAQPVSTTINVSEMISNMTTSRAIVTATAPRAIRKSVPGPAFPNEWRKPSPPGLRSRAATGW